MIFFLLIVRLKNYEDGEKKRKENQYQNYCEFLCRKHFSRQDSTCQEANPQHLDDVAFID